MVGFLLALFVVFVAPGGHGLEDWHKIAAFGCERVLGAGRDLGIRFFRDHTVALEGFESLAEGARIDAANGFLELAKAFWASVEVADNQRSPFLTENTEC